MTPGKTDRPLRCIVIGAGVSGILIGIKLLESLKGQVEFCIFEKNEDIGGTWLENRYPGCACDVPSHIYQYSFIPNPDWSTFYASSAEIRSYIKAVASHYGVDKHITFKTLVTRAVWDDNCAKWTVSVEGQGDFECDVLINASGILNNFRFPTIKNLETFQGPTVHTAAWEPDTDINGKRIAIIGAGASAIQLLPAIQKDAAHIDVYIRTPSWIMPPILESMATASNFTYTAEDCEKFRADAEYSVRIRKEMESASNKILKCIVRGSDEQTELRDKLEKQMKVLITDEELQNYLIPTFEVGCRRTSPGEPYLHALQKENVTPVFGNIDEVTPKGVISGGKLRSVDVIIAATGFDTSFRPRFPIIGRNGSNLREMWKDEPEAYCGLAVSGFPNYLMFLGPNTPISNGSVMGTLEVTADYFIRIMEKLVLENVQSFDVLPEAQADFDAHTQDMMKNMVWSGDCRSWYKNERGKIVAVWPGSSLHYREVLQSNRWQDYEWRYRGNRFEHWGTGFSKVEDEPGGDLAYYIVPSEPLPRVVPNGLKADENTVELVLESFRIPEAPMTNGTKR